jgi:hypothetical protein
MMTIKRVEIAAGSAWSVVQWYGESFAVALERAYPGQRGAWTTKITPGVYECVRSRFNKAKEPYDTWKIVGGLITPQREIKFHRGNWPEDSEGCPLVGEAFDYLTGRRAILSSGAAFSQLMKYTEGLDRFQLAVLNV